MLTAEQIEVLQTQSGQLLDPITDFLIEDIAQRVKQAGQYTGTASYETWQLQQLGLSQKEIKKQIAKRLGISQKEAKKLLTQAAETGYNFDMDRFPADMGIPFAENTSLQQILQATVKQAGADLTNITKTMGFVGPDGVCRELTDAYRNACDFAFQKVSLGAQDYESALRDATRNLAKKGIRYIDYKSGRHYSIETATRRSLMGGLGKMQEQITQSNHDYLGCDGWEISAHSASAPDHEPIQGKQYTDEEYKKLNARLIRPIGTLNCGHAAFPIIMGVNDPQYTDEELEQMCQENETGVFYEGQHYTLYKATQKQRKYERAIRNQKRKILVDEALEDKEQLQIDQIRLVRLRQEYARFSEGVGLPMQHARAEAAGFTWKHGKAAQSTAKQAKNREYTGGVQQTQTIGKTQRPKRQSAARAEAGKAASKRTSDVTWDNSQGSTAWKPDRYKRLLSAERTSIRSPIEIGTLYDSSGKRIFRIKGDRSSVEFTPAQIRQMRGGVLTHNHPGADYGCFSPADINMLREGYLSEMRLATPAGVFSIQRPKRWPSSINGFDKIQEVYYDIYEPIGGDYFARAFRGEISLLDANNLSQQAAIERLCRRYKMPFKFEAWDNL